MARLGDLLAGVGAAAAPASHDVEITGITVDSRAVRPGDLFACTPGYEAPGGETRADRHAFVADALARGAVALLIDRKREIDATVPLLRVENVWSATAKIAAALYGEPSRALFAVGITGTSGKTSTSYFVDSVLARAGYDVARLGTIEHRIGVELVPSTQTTPEAPVLQQLLRRAVDAGCTAAVMEVSSHALALHRCDSVELDVGIFTNLSRDHLNFHPDMESYLAAKARLFDNLGDGAKEAVAIVNADDAHACRVVSACAAPVLEFGLRAGDVRAERVRVSTGGVAFHLVTPRGRVEVELPHLGDYTVYNALAAAALGEHLEVDLETTAAALRDTPSVPGRFERVEEGQSFSVVIDYAHKPRALQVVLESARRLGPRRIITVFGCGGDRDRGKRPEMGQIAARESDFVIVTSDNPRSECERAIVDDITAGSREEDPSLSRHLVEVDRARAIRCAIEMAEPGDMVVIAGKGHERYQLVAGRKIEFDDARHARAALRSKE